MPIVSDILNPTTVEKAASPIDPWEEYYKREQHNKEKDQQQPPDSISSANTKDSHKSENAYQKAEEQLRHLVKSYKQSFDRNEKKHQAHQRSQNQRGGNDNDHNHNDHQHLHKPKTTYAPSHTRQAEKPHYPSQHHQQTQQNKRHHDKPNREYHQGHSNLNHSPPQEHYKNPAHLSHLRPQPIIARPIGSSDFPCSKPISNFKPEQTWQEPNAQPHYQPLPNQSQTSRILYDKPIESSAQQLQTAHQVYLNLIHAASSAPTPSSSSQHSIIPPPARRLSRQHSHPRIKPKRINPNLPSPFSSSLPRNVNANATSDSSDLDADEPHGNTAGQFATTTKPSAKDSLEVRI